MRYVTSYSTRAPQALLQPHAQHSYCLQCVLWC